MNHKVKPLRDDYGQQIQSLKADTMPNLVRLHKLYYVKVIRDEDRNVIKSICQLEIVQ